MDQVRCLGMLVRSGAHACLGLWGYGADGNDETIAASPVSQAKFKIVNTALVRSLEFFLATYSSIRSTRVAMGVIGG